MNGKSTQDGRPEAHPDPGRTARYQAAPGCSSVQYTDSHRTYCPYPQIPAPLQTAAPTGSSHNEALAQQHAAQGNPAMHAHSYADPHLQSQVQQQLEQLLPTILRNHVQALQQPLSQGSSRINETLSCSSTSNPRADLSGLTASLTNQQGALTGLTASLGQPGLQADQQKKEDPLLQLQVQQLIDERLQALKYEMSVEFDRKVQEAFAAGQATMDRKYSEQSRVLMEQVQQLVETMRDMQARLGQQMEENNDVQAKNLDDLRRQLVALLPVAAGMTWQAGSPRQQAQGAAAAAAAPAAPPPTPPAPTPVQAAARAAAPGAAAARQGLWQRLRALRPGELSCHMCDERFMDEDVLKVHLFTDHNIRDDQQQDPAADGSNHRPWNNAPADALQCFACNKNFQAQDDLEAHLLIAHPELMYDNQHNLDQPFGAATATAAPAAAAGTSAAAAAGRGAAAATPAANVLLVRVRYGANHKEAMLHLPRDATVGQLQEAVEAATGHEPWMLLGPSVAIRSTTDAAARIDTLFSPHYLASGEIQLTMALRPNSSRSVAA